MADEKQNGYFSTNGLDLYYEVQGQGQPLVLLHGGMTSLDDFHFMMPELTKHYLVIASDRQGHGRTADIDRPFSMDQMADDTVELIRYLNFEKVDIIGYSTGAIVALSLATRYPEILRKLVLASGIYSSEGYYPQFTEGIKHMRAEDLPPIMRELYEKVAPHPENWPKLVAKASEQAAESEDWGYKPEQIRAIQAPTLVLVAEHDIVRPEHSAEFANLLPHGQLETLPGADHSSYLMHPEQTLKVLTKFLDAPMPS